MFRHENKRTKEKAERSYKSTRASSLGLINNGDFSILSPVKIDFNMWLSLSADDIAVCEFYHSILDNLSHEDDTRFLHTQLPALYTQSPLGSALRLSTEAIAYACSTKIGHKAAELSRERYVTAIKAVERAIRDPVEVKSDQTLYAILLLCGFEVSIIYLCCRSAT
jgi:hypothetical protein